MRTHRHYKGSNLFLVRLWAKDMGEEITDIRWRGKVLRVLDGESHEFSSLQGLVDVLLAMVSDNERR